MHDIANLFRDIEAPSSAMNNNKCIENSKQIVMTMTITA